MRVAIIGAGFTGLSAAYELSKKGHRVVVFEKNHFAGGLASGVRSVVSGYPKEWEWDLERFYHHWFTNDEYVLDLIDKIGVSDQLITARPITASWRRGKAWQLDSPFSLLRFSPVSLLSRVRTGAALAYLKYLVSPDKTGGFENVSAAEWLQKYMGKEAFQVLWQPLLQGKFDKYYSQINMTWFWARIYKRTPRLGYFKGGFGRLVECLVEKVTEQGGRVEFGAELQILEKMEGGGWRVEGGGEGMVFDKIIATTPPPALAKLVPKLPLDYKAKLTNQTGLGALCLILVLDQPLLKDVYWLNISEPGWPFLAVVEHTNFVDPQYYGGKHIVYIGDYLPADHPHLRMDREDLLDKFTPYLQKINSNFQPSSCWLFRETFAQPIVGLNHAKTILPLKTPFPGLYLASMSQVYPWDRGTNYSVELGRRAAQEVLQGDS